MKQKFYITGLALLLATSAVAQNVPKAELFLGYNYVRVNSTSTVSSFSSNGGSGQLALNFSKYLSGVIDLGGYHNGVVNGYQVNNTIFSYMIGPRVSIRNHSRVTPYFNILFGGMYLTASGTPITCPAGATASQCTPGYKTAGSTNGFAMAAGGGMDIRINKHVAFRPIGLDYFLTRVKNPVDTQDHNQNNLRYSAGFNFMFGGEKPEPPPTPPTPTKQCWDGSSIPVSQDCPKRNITLGLNASQSEICQGAAVTITPAAGVPGDAKYQWSIDGQPVSQAATLDFGATGRQPGTYKVGLSVAADGYNDATAATSVTVRPYGAPTGGIQVSPSEIWAGDKATVTANFAPGQCGGDLRPPTYTASEGWISGGVFDSATVQFDPSNNAEQRKTVKITAKVTDGKGGTDAEASVVVKKRAMAKRLPDIIFPEGNSRVNNCGKRVLLEELKPYLANDPTGKVVLVGHVHEKEKASGLDQRRALNAAAVLSAGQGVCYNYSAANILVGLAGSTIPGGDYQSYFCGTSVVAKVTEAPGNSIKESDLAAKYRRVEVWFVPTGAEPPAFPTGYQDAASLAVGNIGCPK